MSYRRKFQNVINWKNALGEIALIFIGISLALWFDNWNDQRKDQQLTKIYYKQLAQSLQKDTARLFQLKQEADQNIQHILNIFPLLSNSKVPADSLSKAVLERIWFICLIFEPQDALMNYLISTGQIKLLDLNIQLKIVELFSKYKDITYREKQIFSNIWDMELNFYRKIDIYATSKEYYQLPNYKEHVLSKDWYKHCNSETYLNWLNLMQQYHYHFKRSQDFYLELNPMIIELLNEIDKIE